MDSLIKPMYSFLNGLTNLTFRMHIILSILIRILLIIYGQIHDLHSAVPYTDIDYKVVTDGARHILDGNSPFERHTYRYSPLMAYIQICCIWLHPAMGKLIYATFDILVALLIYNITKSEKYTSDKIAKASACFWLYNPLTMVISTRGNGDSFSSFFVILTIYLLTKSEVHSKQSKWIIFLAGLVHGLAIHLRLYPLMFSLAYYLYLSERLVKNFRDFLRILLFPNAKQILLVFGTILGLTSFTFFFYYAYGWKYIYEAYFYHFVRKDARHNFSFYFLMQYLSGGAIETSLIEKILILLPQIFLILYLSFSFGQFRQTLGFAIFAIAFVLVTFNSVVTSQYFVWYLALLPLCLKNFQSISIKLACVYFTIWLVAQGLWLLPAYLLEFKTWNTFYWIFIQSGVFFVVNNLLLTRFIEHFKLK